jgi:CheY-like chemotaxis protein
MKRNATILVVEDDVWFAEQHLRTLQGAGFKAKHVTDGIAAIQALDESLPDVIVLDIFLPGPNAFVLLHEMQSYADLSALPVIICTGSVPAIHKNVLAAYGVTSILDKAVMQPDDLVAAVRRVLV